MSCTWVGLRLCVRPKSFASLSGPWCQFSCKPLLEHTWCCLAHPSDLHLKNNGYFHASLPHPGVMLSAPIPQPVWRGRCCLHLFYAYKVIHLGSHWRLCHLSLLKITARLRPVWVCYSYTSTICHPPLPLQLHLLYSCMHNSGVCFLFSSCIVSLATEVFVHKGNFPFNNILADVCVFFLSIASRYYINLL